MSFYFLSVTEFRLDLIYNSKYINCYPLYFDLTVNISTFVDMIANHITQAMANPEIIAELGRRFKEYRLANRLTQKEAAEKAGVSLITLRQFENGKAYNINMGNFLALLRVVDCLEQMNELLPEIPVSAYAIEQTIKKKPQRIRHGK